ncbi:MAG: carboxylesterase/lipase family protein [Burkholderiales bacterium]
MGTAEIQIDSGKVAGIEAAPQVHAWLGIPFAAPPTGELRFRAPQPAVAWQGVRQCDRYGNACVQHGMPANAIMKQFSFEDPPECGTSEDCLYLNVWAPQSARVAKLPVMVFLYGGGHRVGSGSHPVSRGTGLAARGAVVVTFNYRLGALGYLAHPELSRESGTSGNYACLDAIAALSWVKRNIAAFGGDPDCVTIFGQSAGAALVNVLMVSPLAKGLFHRAITHSSGRFEVGAGPVIKTLAEAEKTGVEICAKLGAQTLAELRALPADAIDAPRGFWGPIVDGRFLCDQVHALFARGEQHDVPLLAGYTANEASPYATPELHTREAFLANARKTYGQRADEFLALFPATDDNTAIASSYALRRDSGFAYQTWKFAQMHAKHAKSPVYLFNFMRAVPFAEGTRFHEPVPPGGYGAYHGAELWYAFDTLDAMACPWQDADRNLAATVSSAWVEFARSGKPEAAGLASWPDFRDGGQAMALGQSSRVAAPFNAPALKFFDDFYSH